MRRFAAFLLALVVAFSTTPLSAFPGEPVEAYAATGAVQSLSRTASPYGFGYTYYSDLAFQDGGSATVAVGKHKQLRLTTQSNSITWTSSNSDIATVTQTGLVTAKRAGVTRIAAKEQKSGRSVVCTVKTYKKRTQAQVRKAILALKKSYYPGRRWTNRNYYFWQAANCHCYGCIAFVGTASDIAFGKYAPLKRHAKFSTIKVGDHVRVGGKHSVIVLYKHKKSIEVAEGNCNSTFKWGRKISYANLKRKGFYVETRY